VSFRGRTGVLGVSPNFINVPQRMGDYQGVRLLFPPFKGGQQGVDLTQKKKVSVAVLFILGSII
jgi:hypothetical protein